MYNIKMDSRRVEKGDTFVAINGLTVDGHDYIEQAIERGATKIIAEHGSYSVETIITENPKKYAADMIIKEYKHIIDKMTIVGITGTNGKSTTAYLVYQLLKKLGNKVSYVGTMGYYNDEFVRKPDTTTPTLIEMYEILIDSYEKGHTTLILEDSSQSLQEGRTEGVEYTVAGFTNLTQDHLDFHGSMEDYLKAKKLILDKVKGSMVVNIDDEYSNHFIKDNSITFGFNESDYQIKEYENNETGTKITYINKNEEHILDTKLRGRYNVHNSMMAFIITKEIADESAIKKAFLEIDPPKGRSQIIPVKDGEAVVDYAHTPDGVEKVISAFNEVKKGRIITVIGCGGDRDPRKRPIMGGIASELSDYVIYTSDNPRTEDPETILEQVVAGAKKDNYEKEVDRKIAIKKALDMIEKNDIVLLLGKGDEDYQIIGRTKIHLDDAEEVQNYIDNN